MNLFDILMIIALGTLAGTMIGLLIGYAARRQGRPWSQMVPREQMIAIVLVLSFSALCVAGLAWYEML
jgi:NhaP-type Na+/H+ or K+/H+ antiporter